MGLLINATLVCDKDQSTTVQLESISDSIPEGWMHLQGYLNDITIDGYLCPVCIATFGTKQLCKDICDSNPDLTNAPE